MSSEDTKKIKRGGQVLGNNIKTAGARIASTYDIKKLPTTTDQAVDWLGNKFDPFDLSGTRHGDGMDQNRLFAQVGSEKVPETDKSREIADEAGFLDNITNREIMQELEQGDWKNAQRMLSAAKKGKGIYAVRRINENESKLLDMRPGRSQLSSRYNIINPID